MSFTKKTDKYTVVHPHNEIPLSNKNKLTFDKCNNVDELQMHYAE